jgi:hypothetical protein
MILGLELWVVDVLGHIGYLFLALGMLLLARRNVLGWACRAVGELIWLFIGFEMQMSSMWVWGVIFIAIEIHGFRSWKMTYIE